MALTKAQRKARARSGRGGTRQGAGRPKTEATIAKEKDVKSVVLNQPHRRGSPSDWLASPVGRLLDSSGYLTAKISKNALYESANRFSESYSKWQAVAGSARPFANSQARSGEDISTERAEKFTAQWLKAWAVLRKAGERQEKAVFATVIDPQHEDWRPPFWLVFGCIEGLKALAVHYGIDFLGEDVEATRAAA